MRSVLPVLLIASAVASAAPQPAVTSAYTTLDLGKCTIVAEDKETRQFATWRCKGYGGVPLFVQIDDERFDLDAGQVDQDGLWSDTFDEQPRTVEWRLNKGKPFAIIYRLTVANSDVPKTSRLKVESVGNLKDKAKFGCRIADIDGAAPRANELARAAADGLLTKQATCIEG